MIQPKSTKNLPKPTQKPTKTKQTILVWSFLTRRAWSKISREPPPKERPFFFREKNNFWSSQELMTPLPNDLRETLPLGRVKRGCFTVFWCCFSSSIVVFGVISKWVCSGLVPWFCKLLGEQICLGSKAPGSPSQSRKVWFFFEVRGW